MSGPSRVILLLLAALVLSGCGGRPETCKVWGRVTVGGKPLAGAHVTLHPSEEGRGRAAHGSTDAAGKYTLTTFQPGDGAVPGEYKVAIKKVRIKSDIDVTTLTPNAQSAGKTDQYAKMVIGNDRESPVIPAGEIPTRYHDPETSDIVITVDPTKPNEFNWDL